MIGSESCSHCNDCQSGCTSLTPEDNTFHNLLEDVSKVLGANVSIFDLPKLYNPSIPAALTESVLLPVHTLCKMESMKPLLVPNMRMLKDGELDDCSELWNDFISNGTKNPYMIPHDKVLGTCSHGVGNVAKYVSKQRKTIFNFQFTFTYFRIELQTLLFIMKFVYHHASMADVEALYDIVKQAKLNIPMKPLEEVLATADLGQPLAISDYLKGLNPLEKLGDNFINKSLNLRKTTKFRPVLTDMGLCSSYNAMSERDIFQEPAIRDFHEVFQDHQDNDIPLKSAVIREYSFIIDTRRDYQWTASHGSHFARYNNFWAKQRIN